jgi:membrane protein involved in colicin uptake
MNSRTIFTFGLSAAVLIIAGTLLAWKQTSSTSPTFLEADHDLQTMQTEVQRQLVEAAKRRALAKKHHEQAIKLAYSAAEDRTTAEVLKRKADLAKRDAVLTKDTNAAKQAEARVKKLKEKSAQLDAAADKDVAQASATASATRLGLRSSRTAFVERREEGGGRQTAGVGWEGLASDVQGRGTRHVGSVSWDCG